MHPRPVVGAQGSVLATFIVSGMLAVVWVARMPALRERLGLSDSQIGIVLLATAVGSLTAMFVVGRLAVRLGSDTVLRWSLPLMAVSAVSIGLAGSFPALFAAALVTGVFLGATDVTMNAQASLLETRTGRRIMSGMHAGWSLGSAAGAGLAAATAAVGASVVVTMLAAAGIVLLTSLLVAGAYQADGGHGEGGGVGPRGRISLPRAIILVGLVMGLALLIEGAVAGWTTLFLHDEFGTVAWLAALGYLLYELAMVTGRLFGDRVRRSWGDRRAAWSGSAVAAVGLAAAALAPGPLAAVVALAVVGVGQSVVVPIAFITAGRIAPQVAAAAIARVGGFGYAGLLAGPAAFGFVAGATSMRIGFAVLGLLAVGMTFAARASAVEDQAGDASRARPLA